MGEQNVFADAHIWQKGQSLIKRRTERAVSDQTMFFMPLYKAGIPRWCHKYRQTVYLQTWYEKKGRSHHQNVFISTVAGVKFLCCGLKKSSCTSSLKQLYGIYIFWSYRIVLCTFSDFKDVEVLLFVSCFENYINLYIILLSYMYICMVKTSNLLAYIEQMWNAICFVAVSVKADIN